jgi:hypothetical protein
LDDLAGLVSEFIDQIKILVSAVDDLRCEVEWSARNAAYLATPTEPCPAPDGGAQFNGGGCQPLLEEEPSRTIGEIGSTERLRSFERKLMTAPVAIWRERMEQDDPPELPTGRIIKVDEDLWLSFVDSRPSHVVERGCDCEGGIGAPFLFAWDNNEGFFLRELTDAESLELQRLCLADQAETASADEPADASATQLGLW